MKLSIYLSETVIRAVAGNGSGKLYIQDCSRFEIKEGTWINDMIIDEDRLKEILRELRCRYPGYEHNIHLVIGSRALTKVLQVPSMTKSQLREISKRELIGYETSREEMVYDYSVIHTDKSRPGGIILCAGLERRIIDGYISLFASCGMRVKTLGIALNSILRLAQYLPELSGKTYIISVLDGRNLMSSLYVEGMYTYTSRVRLLPEYSRAEHIEEIIVDINAIIKFHKMQGMDREIGALYFCGLRPDEETVYFPRLTTGTSVPARAFGRSGVTVADNLKGYRLGDYVFASGNLLGR